MHIYWTVFSAYCVYCINWFDCWCKQLTLLGLTILHQLNVCIESISVTGCLVKYANVTVCLNSLSLSVLLGALTSLPMLLMQTTDPYWICSCCNQCLALMYIQLTHIGSVLVVINGWLWFTDNWPLLDLFLLQLMIGFDIQTTDPYWICSCCNQWLALIYRQLTLDGSVLAAISGWLWYVFLNTWAL